MTFATAVLIEPPWGERLVMVHYRRHGGRGEASVHSHVGGLAAKGKNDLQRDHRKEDMQEIFFVIWTWKNLILFIIGKKEVLARRYPSFLDPEEK